MLAVCQGTASSCFQFHPGSRLRQQCSRRPCRLAAFSSMQLQDPVLESAFSTVGGAPQPPNGLQKQQQGQRQTVERTLRTASHQNAYEAARAATASPASCTGQAGLSACRATTSSRIHTQEVGGPQVMQQQQQEALAGASSSVGTWQHSSSSSGSGGPGDDMSRQQELQPSRSSPSATRRQANQLFLLPPTLAAAAATSGTWLPWLSPPPAAASKLPGFADSAWEALGGGPSDLFFPEEWLGVWDVVSTLTKVDLPLGEDLVSNLGAVQRAQQQDLNQPQTHQVAFMRNQSQRIIYDRRFNTAALLASYYGPSADFSGRIAWNPDDPNVLSLTVPGGLTVRTRVTRRSASSPSPQRLETSEYLEQVFDNDEGGAPRVKASQCFTKYLWRGEAEAGEGPAIVATQVVSDYLTPYDGEQRYLTAMNKPVTTYTYKMAFRRHHEAGHTAAALVTS